VQLYQHQTSFINDIRTSLIKHKKVIACASTGMGKTVCIGDIVNRAKKHVIITVHRRELLRQTQKTLDIMGCANYTLTTIQTLTKKDFTEPSLLIVDECHLSMARTWKRVIDKCEYVIGFSATPCRLDSRPLGDIYKGLVEAKSMPWLIENGFLSKYDYYAPHIPTMPKGSTKEYATADILSAMNGKVLSNAVEKWCKYTKQGYTVVFCPTVEHSKLTAKVFTKNGIPAEHIDGSMSDKQRKEAIERFVDNGGVLCNVNLLIEGFDLSAQTNKDITVENVVILRPTKSLSLFRQMVGRALRKKDKPAVILDMAGNLQLHGMPDDVIQWSLDGKTKRESDALSIQRCPTCFHIQKPSPVCWSCGHVFQADGKQIQEIDGTLVVIDSDTWRDARREQVRKATTLKELVAIEKARQYKNRWAECRYEEKHGTRPTIEETAKARGYSSQWVWQAKKRRR